MSKRARDMAFRHFNRGVSLIEKGLHEEALEILKKAEEQAKQAESPEMLVAALQTYADLLFAHDRKEEALERYYLASELLENRPEFLPLEQRANMFSNMASALESAGEKDKARVKYEIAAQNYRELIEKQAHDTSHISNAVANLNNMGALLAEVGRNGEALEVLDEAFDLHEKTSDEEEKEAHQQKKGTILENLLNIPLDDVSGIDEERYTKLLEQYAGINANNKGLLKMSTALRNIAHIHEKEGNTEAAFVKLEEALEITSKLFDEKPEDPVSRKMLIDILRDMNRLLEKEEHSERLLEMYGVILQMSRKLLNSMPENTSYQLNVAFSLNIIGSLLKDADRIDEAIPKMEESVKLALQVLEKEKDDSSSIQVVVALLEDMLALIDKTNNSNRKLELYNELGKNIRAHGQENLEIGLISAGISHNIAQILSDNGTYSEALDHFKMAFKTYETVRHATGDSSKMNDVLGCMAKTQNELGLVDDALSSYMQLIKNGVTNKRYSGNIDEILLEKEKIADNTGNVEFLKKEYERIIDIRTDILGMVPDEDGRNAANIRKLQEKIADLMVATGQTEEALEVYEQLHKMENEATYLTKITQLLDKMKTSVAEHQTPEKMKVMEFLLSRYDKLINTGINDSLITVNRAAVIENIASMHADKGNLESSGKMYEAALDAYSELAGINPNDVLPVERIASIHSRIAEIANGTGNSDEAKERYETSLNTYKKLLELDPFNVAYQLDYANVFDGIGALFLETGMHTEAKKSYESALKAFGEVMESEPDNKAYRTNVTITLENLGYILEIMGRKEDALWMYENARKIEDGIE